MYYRNRTGMTQILVAKKGGEPCTVPNGEAVNGDDFSVPDDPLNFPHLGPPPKYESGKIWGVLHTLGSPHLRACLENVKNHVDGFISIMADHGATGSEIIPMCQRLLIQLNSQKVWK